MTSEHPTSTETETMPPFPSRLIKFGPFTVTSQVFHTTPHTFALVNLKPLLPGHILICPLHPHQRLTSLSSPELSDLFATVTRVQKTLRRLYGAEAFNVAVQDGPAAGQTVPHVHVHVIPRKGGDGGEGDKVHQWLEGEEGDVGGHLREVHEGGREDGGQREVRKGSREEWPKDEERKPRSKEVMEEEAGWLREEMERDAREEGEGKL